MTSRKQIAANRLNAKRSTGPVSPDGKSLVSHNALKHGILSREAVIERGDVTEDMALYEQMRDALFEEVKPVGMLETMLADKLFTFYWRHYRVVLAERAIIEEAVLGHRFKRILQRAEDAGHQKEFALIKFHERTRTSHGCRQLLEEAEAVLGAVETEGLPLPEWAMNKLTNNLGLVNHFPRSESLYLYSNMVKDKEQLGIKEEGVKKLTALAKKTAQSIVEFCKTGVEVWEQLEADEDKVTAEAKLLPSEDDLQRIQRYEAHLHRCFMHTLHELQRMQSNRMGNPAPLAAALDVTLDSPNGFES
ncbi:MAG: hypothetical protein V1876_03110 [Candidatus Peregrinibacteria bacterium]